MKYSKIILAVAAACILGAIIFFLADGSGEIPGQPPDTSPITQAHTPQSSPDIPSSEAASPEPSAKPEPEIIVDTDASTKIREILLSATEYYNDMESSSAILTQNGLLYNIIADIIVTPDYLVKREYLLPDYLLEGSEVLFLSSDSVSDLIPSYVDYSGELRVYVVAPFEDGYIIDSKGLGAVKITSEDYEELLAPYDINHGNIRKLTGSSEEYADINAVIKEYQKTQDDFFIRYGARNDKYAVVIVSPKNNYSEIYQYLLVMENGKWRIRIPNLESVTKTRAVANGVCPDLDNKLMPAYDVKSYQGYMMKDFSGVTEKLIADGYLTEENAVLKYISATDKFMFVKYENGQMFVGVNPEGEIWVLGEVESPENAMARFKSIDENAPDFVIIWE